MKQDRKQWQRQGVVTETLPSASFRVRLDGEENDITAHIAGRVRRHHIRILVGDRVLVELSPYDPTQGRIIYRL